MDYTPAELGALVIASANEEGRMVVFDPNDGPLSVIGLPGEGHLELGQEGLDRLVARGLIRFGGGHSYLITPAGRRALEHRA